MRSVHIPVINKVDDQIIHVKAICLSDSAVESKLEISM